MILYKKHFRTIKKVTEYVILGFLFTVLVFVVIPLLPIQNNYSLKMVTSGSMTPTIKIGAIVMVRAATSYKIKDIITFQVGSGKRDIVTHRIISRKGDEFITKGDANNVADINPVKKENILGRVVFNISYAGYIANVISSKIGILILVLIPALLIIISEGKKIWLEIKKKKSEKNKLEEKITNKDE